MSFGRFVRRAGELVVQPRMGFGDPHAMRRGLIATWAADATTCGTLTLDSYTRVNDLKAAADALRDGSPLNGYPIVTHSVDTTRRLLEGIAHESFPVQVRHGSAKPQDIVRALTAVGLDATEGGPVSYCLPYGRTPLRESIANWRETCGILADSAETPHLESFGGCLLGQLCPPSLLIAVSVLEGIFFTRNGIPSVSLSYAQQTDPAQDEEAIRALRTLAARHLPTDADWHVVLYGYMGVYPTTTHGALNLLKASAELAARTGTERLIVKTVAESQRIPTVEENVQALEVAAAAARAHTPQPSTRDTGILDEASALIDAVLNLDDDLGRALAEAFARGVLDVPFCLHPDNTGQARSTVGDDGTLRWTATGAMPIPPSAADHPLTSERLLTALTHVARAFDR
ncbi:methylaspartate mutase [Actinokineospora pegani]|uniref:methylaspartate mutase n=1 Tax=Actinokineospora pegani TaxID=2654637 RepID=UPI0012EACBB8|nr:methylaspartate mutase [Actinokineospora pegani]